MNDLRSVFVKSTQPPTYWYLNGTSCFTPTYYILKSNSDTFQSGERHHAVTFTYSRIEAILHKLD